MLDAASKESGRPCDLDQSESAGMVSVVSSCDALLRMRIATPPRNSTRNVKMPYPNSGPAAISARPVSPDKSVKCIAPPRNGVKFHYFARRAESVRMEIVFVNILYKKGFFWLKKRIKCINMLLYVIKYDIFFPAFRSQIRDQCALSIPLPPL